MLRVLTSQGHRIATALIPTFPDKRSTLVTKKSTIRPSPTRQRVEVVIHVTNAVNALFHDSPFMGGHLHLNVCRVNTRIYLLRAVMPLGSAIGTDRMRFALGIDP